MPLIATDAVKQRFPKWETFLQRERDPEAALALQVEEAERELRRYVAVDDPLPDELDPLLMALVRKHVFCSLHGDTEFEAQKRPQIIRDYDKAVKELERYRSGELRLGAPTEEEAAGTPPMIESKPRRFGTWFR
jgi:hypothetical protein